jgi:hypothetical protein
MIGRIETESVANTIVFVPTFVRRSDPALAWAYSVLRPTLAVSTTSLTV